MPSVIPSSKAASSRAGQGTMRNGEISQKGLGNQTVNERACVARGKKEKKGQLRAAQVCDVILANQRESASHSGHLPSQRAAARPFPGRVWRQVRRTWYRLLRTWPAPVIGEAKYRTTNRLIPARTSCPCAQALVPRLPLLATKVIGWDVGGSGNAGTRTTLARVCTSR